MRLVSRLAATSVLLAAVGACDGASDPSLESMSSALASARGVVTLPARASPHTPLQVTVTDADANVDDTEPDAVLVYVKTSASPSPVRFALAETGASTGVFSAPVTIPSNAADGQTVTVTYRDPNADAATCGPAIVDATVAVNTKVDLSIEKLEIVDAAGQPLAAPSPKAAGEQIRIHVVVRNDTAAAWSSGTGRMPVYFIGPGEYQDEVDARPIDYPGYPLSSIPPGGTQEFFIDYRIPTSIGGPWSISASVYMFDDDGYEFSYGNNSRDLPLQITPADLSIPTLSIDPAPVAGGFVTISGTVRNAGGGVAGPTLLKLRFVGPKYWDYEGYPVRDWYLVADPTIGELAADAPTAFSVTYQIPDVHGACSLWAYADGDNAVVEPNENDNTRQLEFVVP